MDTIKGQEGMVTKTLSGVFADDDYAYNDSSHPEWFLQKLNELRKTKQFCDITLCVGNQNFQVHKIVLAAFSNYFKMMFLSDLSESQQEFITLNAVESDMVELLLDFAYTSKITINSSNVQNLLSAANFMEISSVKSACCRFMEKNILSFNCIGIHCFAEAHCCYELAEKAKEFALENFTSVMKEDEWLNLSLDKVIEFLSNDELQVEKEEIVYQACSMWLHEDLSARSSTFHKVLEHIRLPLISPYFLSDFIEAEVAVRSSPECRVLLEETKSYHLLPDRRSTLNLKTSAPRKMSRHLTGIVVVGGSEETSHCLRFMEVFNPVSRTWSGLAHLPHPVRNHGIAVTGDNLLYLAGGELRDGKITKALWRYDQVVNEWSELAPMNESRAELGLIAMDGLIYAICGHNSYERLSTMEVYNPKLNEWTYCDASKYAMSLPSVASHHGKLYVCGGYLSDYNHVGPDEEARDNNDHIQMYDPVEDKWDRLPKMLLYRHGASSVVLNDCIYSIGGKDMGSEANSNAVAKYDIKDNEWIYLEHMNEKRYRPGIAVYGGKIYVLGGEEGYKNYSGSVECYDPVLNKWSVAGEMIDARAHIACDVLKIRKSFPKITHNNYGFVFK